MGFEKLQQRLKEFFVTETSRSADANKMARIRERTLIRFSQQKTTPSFFHSFHFGWIRSAVVGAIILSFVPLFGERSAGDLSPTGLVEVVRDGEVFIATGKTPLRIGDQILVGNNASAEIQLRKSLKAVASDSAEIRVPRKDALFLVKGSLDGDITNGSIETNRGQINSDSMATLNVFVSDSGETHIRPLKNDIWVTAWNQNRANVAEGETLRLKTDTQLPPEIPVDLRLSSSQILAIQSKLLIARTRALNSIDALAQNDTQRANSELESAETTFRSIAQVLKSSRNLEMLRRENLDVLSREEVLKKLAARTGGETLLENAAAVDTLLMLAANVSEPKKLIAESGLLVFDRYTMLQRLFAPLSGELRSQGALLQQQYIQAISQQIMNAPVPGEEIDSIAEKISHGGTGRLFLQQTQELLLPTEAARIQSHLDSW